MALNCFFKLHFLRIWEKNYFNIVMLWMTYLFEQLIIKKLK